MPDPRITNLQQMRAELAQKQTQRGNVAERLRGIEDRKANLGKLVKEAEDAYRAATRAAMLDPTDANIDAQDRAREALENAPDHQRVEKDRRFAEVTYSEVDAECRELGRRIRAVEDELALEQFAPMLAAQDRPALEQQVRELAVLVVLRAILANHVEEPMHMGGPELYIGSLLGEGDQRGPLFERAWAVRAELLAKATGAGAPTKRAAR